MALNTLTSLKKLLDKKEISCIELTHECLKNAKSSPLNAFITITENEALESAKTQQQLSENSALNSPLAGIPIAHKDIFCTKGILTSCASKILENFISPYDATVVSKLNDAGSISIGKTNLDEFAMGSSNESSFYGAVDNPWNTDFVPGGSSGGSAVAVAAGIVPFATGTDTGGSVRQPAAYCNLTGLKPTYGRCSRYGMIAYASSLDQAGIFTHTAEDAAIALNAMSGFDEKDSTSLNIANENFSKDLNNTLDELTIGIPEQFFTSELNPEVADLIQQAIKEYEKMGATIKDISLPNSPQALPAYYIIAPAEASSNLSRFDGVRYGFRAEHYEDLNDMYTKTRSQGFGPEVQKRIMIGAYALSSGYYDAYYAKAQKLRRLITNDYLEAFKDCDVVLGPTTPEPAFKKGSTADPVSMYLNDMFTVTANLSGLPAISIPAGFTKTGLPVGMQLTAPHLQEAKLLNVAHQYQLATDHHNKTPANYHSLTSIGGQS